jgi:6-phosphogluconate dehydrogenase
MSNSNPNLLTLTLLSQAQRDYFLSGHTHERTDRPGAFHAQWTDAHHDPDANARKAESL